MSAQSTFTSVKIRVRTLTLEETKNNHEQNYVHLFAGPGSTIRTHSLYVYDGEMIAHRTKDNWLVIRSCQDSGLPLNENQWIHSWQRAWENDCVELFIPSMSGWIELTAWSRLDSLTIAD